MDDIRDKVLPIFKGAIMESFGAEELFLDAARDLIKDEIKRYLREILNTHPDISAEFKEAIKLYMEARLKQAYAGLKIAKTSAKLGLELIPSDMRENMTKEFMKLFEKEFLAIIEKTL